MLNLTDLFVVQNRLFLIMNVLVVPSLVNILIAYAMANILFQSGADVFFWGENGMLIDMLISSFMASLITSLIAFYSTLSSCNRGLLSLRKEKNGFKLFDKLSPRPVLACIYCAILALLLSGLILGLFVSFYDENHISWSAFLISKSTQAMLISIYSSLAGTLLAIRFAHNKPYRERYTPQESLK